MPYIFKREPAAWLALVAILVKLVSAFWVNVSVDQQSLINAVAAAIVGLVVAASTHDGIAAAIYGLAQSALALAVGYGLHWSADQQAVLLSAVSIVLALFTRTQVTAKAVSRANLVSGPRVGYNGPSDPDGVDTSSY